MVRCAKIGCPHEGVNSYDMVVLCLYHVHDSEDVQLLRRAQGYATAVANHERRNGKGLEHAYRVRKALGAVELDRLYGRSL